MISAAATPSQVRLRSLRSGYCVRKACILLPNDDGLRGGYAHPRNYQVRKSAGVVLEGEGRQRRRVIRMEGAFLLPTVRRSQSINGLLYARERIREFWLRKRAQAIQRKRRNGKRGWGGPVGPLQGSFMASTTSWTGSSRHRSRASRTCTGWLPASTGGCCPSRGSCHLGSRSSRRRCRSSRSDRPQR